MIMLSREEWGMPGKLGPIKSGPFGGVDLHHTAALDEDGSDPIRDLYGAAAYTSRKWGRVSYNAGIDIDAPDRMLEMQGKRIGAHNDGENSTRFGLVIAGNFQLQRATDELVAAIGDAVIYLHHHGFIRTTHIKGHRDSDSTACPGRYLYRRLPDIRAHIQNQENDVARQTPNPWAEKAVEAAKEKGVLKGDFDLDANVNDERLMVYLHRAGVFDDDTGGGGGVSVAQVHAIIEGTKLNP